MDPRIRALPAVIGNALGSDRGKLQTSPATSTHGFEDRAVVEPAAMEHQGDGVGPGSRAAGLAMAYKLIEAAQSNGERSTHPTSSHSCASAPPSPKANPPNPTPRRPTPRTPPELSTELIASRAVRQTRFMLCSARDRAFGRHGLSAPRPDHTPIPRSCDRKRHSNPKNTDTQLSRRHPRIDA